MEFNDNKPIYRQITDYAYTRIITGEWESGKRIPSVRELTALLGVNSRTVLKAMENLQQSGIIKAQRGMGFILATDAKERVNEERRREFFATTLPAFVREMELLGIDSKEILEHLPDSDPENG